MSQGSGGARSGTGLRFKLGVGLFVLGLVCPVFVPLVTASALPMGWKTTLSGLLLLGLPELLWVVAAAVMGREGFDALKGWLFGLIRRQVLPKRVGRVRYRVGLVLFVLPLLFGWLAPYVPNMVPGYASDPLPFNLGGDVVLLVGLVVLGGEFWDKLWALFVYDAKVVLTES